jgi:hypothetical protein
MAFIYNKNLKQKAVDRGEPVDNGVSTASFDPDFTNKYSSLMRDTNQDPNKKSLGVFSNKAAEEYARNKIPFIDGEPNFEEPIKNARAKQFVEQYIATFLVPDEEKATASSTLGYITGDPNSNLRGKFPGSEGVATT